MIQLSLTLGVLGRKNSEALQKLYTEMMNRGYTHEQMEDEMLDVIRDRFDNEIEDYCNRHMIFSNLKVAEDIVEELKKLRN